ncbi:MAG: carbohydrate kinase family protein [Eisenbergiella sp.]
MGMKESMETSRSIEVVGIGIPYYDMVINVNKMPGLDGAASANEAFYQGGGKVATAMAAVARLGRRAGIIAKVGENHRGRFVLEDFRYNGVDTSAVIVDEPGTSSPFAFPYPRKSTKPEFL